MTPTTPTNTRNTVTDLSDGQPSSSHPSRLSEFLDALSGRVVSLTEVRRMGDPQPDDPFLGLYISDERLGCLLDRPPLWNERQVDPLRSPQTESGDDPISILASSFALSPDDQAVLITAAAPDLDPRFERFYGYLNDDVTIKRATVSLALELCGLDPFDPTERARCLSPHASRLLAHGLIEVEEPDRPMMTRSLRVPDRVVQHLLGGTTIDDELHDLVVQPARINPPDGSTLAVALRDTDSLMYIRHENADLVREVAQSVAAIEGITTLLVDLEAMSTVQIGRLAGIAGRECGLTTSVLVAGPVDALGPNQSDVIAMWANASPRVVLHGSPAWDPAWSPRSPSQHDVPTYGAETRQLWWHQHLGASGSDSHGLTPEHVDSLSSLRLSATGIQRAAATARTRARHSESPLDLADLLAGVRQQNAARLQSLSTCVEPQVNWDHLVVPADVESALRRLASRVRHRDLVVTEWGMRPGGNRGAGVTALFAGDPGTGKTMSAEVIASELGIDLYVINLATLVDKYIGETEKNLDRVFTDAAGVNGVLLFDEADAIFGQRSEVKDSHDRYANLEVAFLLQRIEQFDGIAILSTNLRSNLDDAFARRLDCIIDFAMPSPYDRLKIWERALRSLPTANIDLEFCAERFKLSGGNIRSIAVTAAYRVAETGDPVAMRTLIACIGEEYRKLGRLCLREEFGDYIDLLVPINDLES